MKRSSRTKLSPVHAARTINRRLLEVFDYIEPTSANLKAFGQRVVLRGDLTWRRATFRSTVPRQVNTKVVASFVRT